MKEGLRKKLIDVAEPIVEELGFELVDAEAITDHGAFVLRLYIDSENGVSIDDCVNVSHALEDVVGIDVFADGPYNLEVSSPGWDRPLRKLEHFEKFKGRVAKLESETPIDGRRKWKGILEGVESGSDVKINVDGSSYHIPVDAIKKARLVPEDESCGKRRREKSK